MRLLLWFMGFVAFGYGLIVLLMYLNQRSFLYFPERERTAPAAAAEHPVGGLILESPFTSTADVGAALYRFLPVRLLMQDQFHSDQRIARVTAPVLVMHGDYDATVPIGYGEQLFAMIKAPKQFVRFAGGGHSDLDSFGALDAARSFLNKL